MAQRLAVLLAIASILVVACAAEAPSVEPATTQKYDKKQHNKHEKPDSYDKDNKPDSYKPDSYKPDSYKPDSYKPDSYKPDSYQPDSYKPDSYKPGSYKPRYKPDSYKHNKHYGDYEQYHESSYNDYYPNGAYDDPYTMPPIYDSGYYAGDGGGHQVALFDVILPENLLNGTFIEDLPGDNDGDCNEDNVNGCRADWGLICGLRGPSHYGPRPTPSGKSYGAKVTGPAISGNPVQPVAVGKGFSRGYLSWQTLDEAVNDDTPNVNFDLRARSLVIINDNQRAYQVGRLTGAIRFGENIEECHPAFTDNTRVRLRRVPIYLMMAKIAIPTDPATYAAVAPRNQNVRQMSARSSTGSHSCGSDDGTLCGIALVAKGPVNIVVRDDNNQVIRRYTANIEFVTGWSNGDINVPRLNEEEEVRRSITGFWEAETLDRACLYNDIPLVRPGSLRIDFVRELEVAPQS